MRPNILPPVADGAALLAAIADEGYGAEVGEVVGAVWPKAIDAICARHGLPRGVIARPGSGSFAVFFVGERLVVKLVPDRWRPQYEAELLMMPRLHGKLSVATPELIAAGDLDEWGYLVSSRVSGVPLGAVFEALSAEGRCGVLRSIGEIMSQVHALSTQGLEPLALDWAAFVETQRASSVARHGHIASSGVSAESRRWISDIPAWLASVVPELMSPEHIVPMTADVTHEAVLVSESHGATMPSALIDFGDALVGDALYDFVSPVTFLVRGRAELLDALFDGYGFGAGARTATLRRRCMAYSLLHRFSTIVRDTGYLASKRELPTLDDALAALWPM